MRVAVTGATGFIGTYLRAELAMRGIENVSLVRTSISTDSWHSSVVIGDINTYSTDLYRRLGSPDVVIHLAWSGLPNYTSLHHIESELPAQYIFLKSLVQSGLSNLVVAGTCFEYGMQNGKLKEDAPAIASLPYSYAKSSLHRQLEFLKTEHCFNLTWCRLFYLFGVWPSGRSLYNQLKSAVESGSGVFNMSGGEQLRDYLCIKSAAAYLADLATLRQDVGAVNICSGEPVSVRTLVERWLLENSWSIDLNLGYYPYASYEPTAFWGDNSKHLSLIT